MKTLVTISVLALRGLARTEPALAALVKPGPQVACDGYLWSIADPELAEALAGKRGVYTVQDGQAVGKSIQVSGGCGGSKVWPAWAEQIREKALAGEKGVGDTLDRITGGDLAGWIRHNVGMCGCRGERTWLNQRYPYAQ